MRSIFNSLKAALKGKFVRELNIIRRYINIDFIKSIGLLGLSKFFTRTLDVKPKNKKDYYTVFNLMVSKRLVSAVVVVFAVVSTYFMVCLSPVKVAAFNSGIETYKYNSLALKLKKDKVQIRAKDGHIAYVGDVYLGEVKGSGNLYDSNQNLVYSGEFNRNLYEGQGTLYYKNKNVAYSGGFSNNLFNGDGVLYREDGSLLYKGKFLNGKKNFEGELYDQLSNKIYVGNFLQDYIVYSDFLKKSTVQVGSIYLGDKNIYNYKNKTMVEMEDIDSAYMISADNETLEDEVIVDEIYVKDNKILMDGYEISDIPELERYLGKPIYYGKVKADFNQLILLGELNSLDYKTDFTDVYTIYGVPDKDLYTYVYKKDGKLYTFYSKDDLKTFDMYSISSQVYDGK